MEDGGERGENFSGLDEECDKAPMNLDGDNNAVREDHEWGIRNERDLKGIIGFRRHATAKEAKYVTTDFGEEVKNVEAVVELDANGGTSVV
jgi:hypothetical protein